MMPNLPFKFGAISQAVYTIATFSWFCTEIGTFIETRTPLGKQGLFWPFWIAVCALVLICSLFVDNLSRRL